MDRCAFARRHNNSLVQLRLPRHTVLAHLRGTLIFFELCDLSHSPCRHGYWPAFVVSGGRQASQFRVNKMASCPLCDVMSGETGLWNCCRCFCPGQHWRNKPKVRFKLHPTRSVDPVGRWLVWEGGGHCHNSRGTAVFESTGNANGLAVVAVQVGQWLSTTRPAALQASHGKQHPSKFSVVALSTIHPPWHAVTSMWVGTAVPIWIPVPIPYQCQCHCPLAIPMPFGMYCRCLDLAIWLDFIRFRCWWLLFLFFATCHNRSQSGWNCCPLCGPARAHRWRVMRVWRMRHHWPTEPPSPTKPPCCPYCQFVFILNYFNQSFNLDLRFGDNNFYGKWVELMTGPPAKNTNNRHCKPARYSRIPVDVISDPGSTIRQRFASPSEMAKGWTCVQNKAVRAINTPKRTQKVLKFIKAELVCCF